MTLQILNNNIDFINKDFPNINKFNEIYIESCINLKNITLSSNITKLFISNCPNLEFIFINSISINKLTLINCYNLRSLPDKLINLKYLKLYDLNIQKIPKSYINLETLIIRYNKNKKYQIKEIPSYDNLTTLILENCNKFKKIPDRLPKINKIHIISCLYIEDIPETYTTIKDYYLYYSNKDIFVKSIKFKTSMESNDDIIQE